MTATSVLEGPADRLDAEQPTLLSVLPANPIQIGGNPAPWMEVTVQLTVSQAGLLDKPSSKGGC